MFLLHDPNNTVQILQSWGNFEYVHVALLAIKWNWLITTNKFNGSHVKQTGCFALINSWYEAWKSTVSYLLLKHGFSKFSLPYFGNGTSAGLLVRIHGKLNVSKGAESIVGKAAARWDFRASQISPKKERLCDCLLISYWQLLLRSKLQQLRFLQPAGELSGWELRDFHQSS